MSGNKPVTATIFAYQVGFGDCFLVRFEYDDAHRRHLLIDFGTTKLPEGASGDHMTTIAEDIKAKCGGKLDIVVATHRHADHISGFTTKANGKGSGDIIRSLSPDVVLQPWTEAPDAPVDSLGPDPSVGRTAFAARKESLASMHQVSAHIVAALDQGHLDASPTVSAQLRFIGEDNLANLSAVKNLKEMGERAGARAVFGFHGCDPQLDDILKGIKVHVLGPPTLHQTETIRKQRSNDEDEFWQLAPLRVTEATGAANDAAILFPHAPYDRASKLLTEQRWLAERIDAANAEQLLGIVRALDDQMNNTSLILLFQAGSKTLLFPGDAQIENWQYALQSPLADLLDNVDFYKVGHHGSRNATPKSLWNRLSKRSPDEKKRDRLTSVMSTLHGKHGSDVKHTEVPRKTLVAELEAESNLHSTEHLPASKLYDEVIIDLR